jgi:hypothetical protein
MMLSLRLGRSANLAVDAHAEAAALDARIRSLRTDAAGPLAGALSRGAITMSLHALAARRDAWLDIAEGDLTDAALALRTAKALEARAIDPAGIAALPLHPLAMATTTERQEG